MIRKIIFPKDSKGYAAKLKLFENMPNPLEVSNGITVLFGPNGCGKSTLLRMIGEYATCLVNGKGDSWYKMPDPWESRHNNGRIYIPGPAGKLELEWDGCPTFYRDFTIYNPSFPHNNEVYTGQTIGEFMRSASRGESTFQHVEDLEKALKTIPDVKNIAKNIQWNDVWNDQLVAWKKYILSKWPAHGKTFLLDEPDAHLSLPTQAEIWEKLIEFSRKHEVQLIAASHSPFVLFRPEISIIEFRPGYVEQCKEIFSKLGR